MKINTSFSDFSKVQPQLLTDFLVGVSDTTEDNASWTKGQIADFISENIISNPSNNLYWAPVQFIQNGMATDGSAIVTGLGSTSSMYVGMTVLGSTFPLATILSIDSDTQITLSGASRYTGTVSLTFLTDRQGSDTTGTGQITKPFATYEKARSLAVKLGAGLGNSFNIIFLGSDVNLGTFNISPYVNIDFNGAYFYMDSIATVGGWDDGNSKIIMQNGQLISTWNLDTSALGTHQKQILWRNIWAQDGGIDIILKGNNSEFFCMVTDTATDAFTFYANKIEAENFSIQLESWIALNSNGIKITNTSDSAGLYNYFEKDVYANVSIVTTGTQSNVLQTRACYIGGTITIDGANASWQPDTLSNKQATLSNGGTIDFSVIQQTLWPMAAATAAPGFVAGPGGAVVLSGVPSLDNFSSFTPNSNYAISQPGQYEFEYMAQISVSAAGNFDVDFHLSNVDVPYANSSVKEQATVTTAFKKTLCGVVTLDLPLGDQVFLLLKNNGDMDVTVDNATWTIKRIY